MAGNAESASLVSCMQRTSGCAYASHSSTRGRRAFSELTFQVAIRMTRRCYGAFLAAFFAFLAEPFFGVAAFFVAAAFLGGASFTAFLAADFLAAGAFFAGSAFFFAGFVGTASFFLAAAFFGVAAAFFGVA